jgi:hypothetical protein
MSMFHSVPGVPRAKMERFSVDHPVDATLDRPPFAAHKEG